jgi:hypothetical protein
VHEPLAQQPVQVVGPQVEPPVQTPAVQVAPGAQFVQVAPFTPQDIGDWLLGAWQTPLLQQPAQLKKSHATVGVQAPAVHEFPG